MPEVANEALRLLKTHGPTFGAQKGRDSGIRRTSCQSESAYKETGGEPTDQI